MQVIRKTSFTAIPWKNGGGITHEVLRVPATGARFDWRVSVATIDASGPFSEFSGYWRIMVLLRGAGVHLSFDGKGAADLRAAGDMAEFDGGVPTECTLRDGPCVDLNVMVATATHGVRAWVAGLQEPRRFTAPRCGHLLVFGIRGAWELELAAGDFTLLEAWDLAVAAPTDRVLVRPAPSRAAVAAALPLVLFAALSDNRA